MTLSHKLSIKKEKEEYELTSISFGIPQKVISNYQKALFPNSEFTMVFDYSRYDDFQHHS